MNIEVNIPGQFILEVRNLSNGCESADSIDLLDVVNPIQGVNLIIKDEECEGAMNGEIAVQEVIGGQSPFTIYLDSVEYGNVLTISNLMAGDYALSFLDEQGCKFDTLINIDQLSGPQINMPDTIYLTLGDSIRIFSGTGLSPINFASIAWGPSSFIVQNNGLNILVAPERNITYSLELVDFFGCKAIGKTLVNVDQNINIFVPNVFSVNGDENNKINVFASKQVRRILDFRILDRWGGLLHHAINFAPGDSMAEWDGRFEGEFLNPGVYVYLLEYELTTGTKDYKVGTITLIR
jgi:gliding motility-associated-like protein